MSTDWVSLLEYLSQDKERLLAAGAGEQNSGHLCRTLFRPVGIRMEKLRLRVDATVRFGCIKLW
ncbi:MAG: hypothetical protein LBI05_03505 [Planctomycetaceae bacterium]|nr:hypothetical protein [Planctomycetaceae bacterium]